MIRASYITYDQLVPAGACSIQRKLFRKKFGDKVQVTVELAREVAKDFDWNWAALRLLKGANRSTYYAVRGLARADYRAVEGFAWDAYQAATAPARATTAATAPAWTAYGAARAVAWADYVAACDAACADYNAACAVAFAQAYIAQCKQEKTA